MTEISRPESIESVVADLAKLKKRIGSQYVILVALLLLALLMLCIRQTLYAYWAGLAAVLFEILFVLPLRRKRKRMLCAYASLFGIGAPLSNCEYEEKRQISPDIFFQYGLSAKKDWPVDAVCRHVVSGQFNGANISVCECSVAYQWGRKKGDIDFQSGTLFQGSGNVPEEARVVCISRKIQHLDRWIQDFTCLGYSTEHFSSSNLNNEFILLTQNDSVPKWLEKMMRKISADGKNPLLLSLHGASVTVFLPSRFYAKKYPALINAESSLLTICRIPERDLLLELVHQYQRGLGKI